MVEKKVEKKMSCLGGDGGGDNQGLGGKKLLLSLSLFELKNVRFSFNTFNLLCISISTVFAAFFIFALATSFLLISSLRKSNTHQK